MALDNAALFGSIRDWDVAYEDDAATFVLQHVPTMVSVHDEKGDYLFANAYTKRLLGIAPEHLIGTNAYDRFHPDDLDVIVESHTGILERPRTLHARYRLEGYDGYIWVETASRTVLHARANEPDIVLATTRRLGPDEIHEASVW